MFPRAQVLTRLNNHELQLIGMAIKEECGGGVGVDDFVRIFIHFVANNGVVGDDEAPKDSNASPARPAHSAHDRAESRYLPSKQTQWKLRVYV